MENPKVSVIIPTYKRSEFLERAINSVLNQTYKNIEIVIVDDNNPETEYRLATESKMLKYNQDSRIKYIQNYKNMGGALARNEGIHVSNGEYITFLDDDDIYLPQKIEKQIKFMINNNFDMTFTDVRINDMNDNLVDYREHNYVDNLENENLLKKHIMHHLTPTDTYMYKKEVLLELGGFDDISMGQEFMLMLRTIENNYKIGYMNESHVIQYLHEEERISVGKNKVKKEKEFYKLKQNYFWKMNFRERQYVRFRHNTVLMIVHIRNKEFLKAIWHFLKAVISSPMDSIFEVINHFKKVRKYKGANI